MKWLGLNKNSQAPTGEYAKFLLKYDGLLIGALSVRDGKWLFEYSDDFRRNQVMRPIVEFRMSAELTRVGNLGSSSHRAFPVLSNQK